jgi:hypothetical protein
VDLSIPDFSVSKVHDEVIVHKTGTSHGGSITVDSTWVRNGGAPSQIGSTVVAYNLTGTTLDGTTVAHVANGNRIELQASPESADPLNWSVFRRHFEGRDIDNSTELPLALSSFNRSYAGAPWAGTSSVGPSGARSWVTGVAPSVGTALNGNASADFNGSTQYLQLSGGLLQSDLVSSTAYRISFLIEFDTINAPAGLIYNNDTILGDGGAFGNFGVVFNTAGIHIFHFDGGYKVASGPSAPSTATKYAVDIVYDGTNITVSMNGVAGTPVAAGTLGAVGAVATLGRNLSGSGFPDCRIWDWYTAQSDLPGVSATDHKNYINSRYGLSL